MKKKSWKMGMSLYHKFALVIVVAGVLPMIVLTSFITNGMVQDYRVALRYQYEQATGYISSSIESMLDSYNTISKLPYYYNFSIEETTVKNYNSFENLRKIVYGECYSAGEKETARERDMQEFLQYVGTVDNYINAAHFIGIDEAGQQMGFHFSYYRTYFRDENLFLEKVGYEQVDKTSNQLLLIPTHSVEYYSGIPEQVFTLGRNYFDLRGPLGKAPYVGTLFLDVRLDNVEKLFHSAQLNGNETVYVVNEAGECFFSTEAVLMGTNIQNLISRLTDTEERLVIRSEENEFGLSVILLIDTEMVFGKIKSTQQMMYFILALVLAVLLAGSIYFSKKLTEPMHEMMEQMAQVESGNFDIKLPVSYRDEIGVLSQRFNQMSAALKEYINQSYVAKIRQNEAELTALKSQIYPHFLYNTLEVIRMTALEDTEKRVPEMIEALSEQIHYCIGPMQDMVPLEKEIDIVNKYVYLLNCRISGKVQLSVNVQGVSQASVPKLILQPIVENAYVHGIKPKKGMGSIMIEAKRQDEVTEIVIMDNGMGMSEEALKKIHGLLLGDEPGIKNEYNWQSIGLKNVQDRIRYLYGEEYGIEVTSTVGVGTMVRILLPFAEQNGEAKERGSTGQGG